MTKPVYIHYGASKFNPKKGFPIRHDPKFRGFFIKPAGGLWASRVDDPNGWREWCKEQDFRDCDAQESFRFTISDKANVIYLSSKADLENSIWYKPDSFGTFATIDYGVVLKEGIDAIEVTDIDELYWPLYGWDCNSIVVLNPDIVEEIEK